MAAVPELADSPPPVVRAKVVAVTSIGGIPVAQQTKVPSVAAQQAQQQAALKVRAQAQAGITASPSGRHVIVENVTPAEFEQAKVAARREGEQKGQDQLVARTAAQASAGVTDAVCSCCAVS